MPEEGADLFKSARKALKPQGEDETESDYLVRLERVAEHAARFSRLGPQQFRVPSSGDDDDEEDADVTPLAMLPVQDANKLFIIICALVLVRREREKRHVDYGGAAKAPAAGAGAGAGTEYDDDDDADAVAARRGAAAQPPAATAASLAAARAAAAAADAAAAEARDAAAAVSAKLEDLGTSVAADKAATLEMLTAMQKSIEEMQKRSDAQLGQILQQLAARGQ